MHKNHPLDDAFDIADENMLRFDEEGTIDIPDDPTLDTIIMLSLRAYKEQMEDIIHIEPKNRVKYLEVAEKFLGQAKDAIHKKETIKLQREKSSGKRPVVAHEAQQEKEHASEKTFSREELLERVRLAK